MFHTNLFSQAEIVDSGWWSVDSFGIPDSGLFTGHYPLSTISSMFGYRYIKVPPTVHLSQYSAGKVVRAGTGLSFFYFVPVTTLTAVPVGSTETPFILRETTLDFQEVSIQGQITYRIADPARISKLLDFSLKNDGATYRSSDPEKVPTRILNALTVLTKAELGRRTLIQAVQAVQEIGAAVKMAIAQSDELTTLGIEVLSFSVLSIKPTPETMRALEAETRENLLRRADEATYARRNAALESERVIKENELQTEIVIEQKKRQIVETQLDSEQAVQIRRLKMDQEKLQGDITLEDRRKGLVALTAENTRAEADARAYGMKANLEAMAGTDPLLMQSLMSSNMTPDQLVSQAFQEMARKADKIGELNITPEWLGHLSKRK